MTNRPQDPQLDGAGWTYVTAEHDEMTCPQAIIATDAQGRAADYVWAGRMEQIRREALEEAAKVADQWLANYSGMVITGTADAIRALIDK